MKCCKRECRCFFYISKNMVVKIMYSSFEMIL
jgi:hypothetical protein